MKRVLRMVSLLLVLAMLLSCFVIAGNAAEETEEEEEADPEADWHVYYNRTYDESGLTAFKGANATAKSNSITAQKEEDGNNYIRIQMATPAEQGAAVEDAFFQVDFEVTATLLVAEVSLKKEKGVPLTAGTVFNYKYYDSANARLDGRPIGIAANGSLTINGLGIVIGTVTEDEWIHVAMVMDTSTQTASFYVNGECKAEKVKYNADGTDYAWMNNLRAVIANASAANAGAAIALDNFRIYEGTHVRDLGTNTGSNVGGSSGGDSTGGTPVQLEELKDAIAMKVNVPYAYAEQKQIAMSDDGSVTPIRHDGTVYVPMIFLAQQLGYSMTPLSETVFTMTKEDSSAILTIGRKSAVKNGEIIEFASDASVINYQDSLMVDFSAVEALFDGYFVTYDDMGLIVISPVEDILNRDRDLDTMITLMDEFVFDNVTGDDIYEDALAYAGGTLSHPRVLATAEQFEAARSAYEAGLAAVAAGESTDGMYQYQWTSRLVNSALNQMIGTSPVSDPVYYYDDGDRMSEWGRSYLVNWAFAYQMILNLEDGTPEKVENRVLRFIFAMSQFDDWNPGHFLNCAGNSQGVALAYDWMYDAWADEDWTVARVTEALGTYATPQALAAFNVLKKSDPESAELQDEDILDVKTFIEDTLYYYGVASVIGAFNNTSYQTNPLFSSFHRSGWKTSENNWNAVINGSMMMTCLALMDVETPISKNTVPTQINPFYDGRQLNDDQKGQIEFNDNNGQIKVGTPLPLLTSSTTFCSDTLTADTATYASEIRWAMTYLMESIRLGVKCYAPDGSYGESPGYWGYGTNHLFYMAEALYSATGKTYGLLNAGGVDTTGLYALYIDNPEGQYWNYHDSGSGGSETQHLGWVGLYLGDRDLAALRMQSVVDGLKSPTMQDVLYYDETLLDLDPAISPDYFFWGIDTATFRSSWERGAVYTGLHGGYTLENHADVDGGNFIYDSNGIHWFVELGTENYNLPGYWEQNATGDRWKYYKKSVEGQNTIFLANNVTYPYGQNINGTARMTDFYSDENGGYAVLDMSELLGGSSVVTSAQRGLLFTNSRKTVVIQDDIRFAAAADLYWVAHINGGTDSRYSAEVTDGGTVAYLYYDSGNTHYTVRATIIPMSPAYSYHFKLMDTTALLAATTGVTDPDSTQVESGRAQYQKLVIEAKNIANFGCAVVIETIENKNLETGYTFQSYENWMPVADTRPEPEPDNPGTGNPDGPGTDSPDPGEPITPMTVINELRAFDAASGTARDEAMLAVARSITHLSDSEIKTIAGGTYGGIYSTYLEAYAAYKDKAERLNSLVSDMLAAAGSLTGQTGEEAGNAAAAAER